MKKAVLKKNTEIRSDSKACGSMEADITGAMSLIRAVKTRKVDPWLRKDGNPIPDAILRQRSAKWSLKTWRRYGAYLEARDPIEARTSERDFETELMGQSYGISETLEKAVPDYQELHAAIESLDPVRRAVIKLVFFEAMSVRETAEILKCPKSNVQFLKSTALSILYEKTLDTCPFIRGKNENLPPRERRKKAS